MWKAPPSTPVHTLIATNGELAFGGNSDVMSFDVWKEALQIF